MEKNFFNIKNRNLIETNFNKNSKKNFNGRALIRYLLEEDEILDGVYFTDRNEFTVNARKVEAEKKFIFIKSINMLNKNKSIFLDFKKTLINFNKIIFLINKPKIKKNTINIEKNLKIFSLFNYYINLNFIKLKNLNLNNNNYYMNSENLIIIIDIRPIKPKIFVIAKNKCLFTVTSGFIYKKLDLKNKKIKKTEKMFNLILKTVFLKLIKKFKLKNYIIHLKGTRANIFNVLTSINKIFKNKKISLIYSPHISYGKFKFKKIKSIKKRLRKKFTRLIKN